VADQSAGTREQTLQYLVVGLHLLSGVAVTSESVVTRAALARPGGRSIAGGPCHGVV